MCVSRAPWPQVRCADDSCRVGSALGITYILASEGLEGISLDDLDLAVLAGEVVLDAPRPLGRVELALGLGLFPLSLRSVSRKSGQSRLFLFQLHDPQLTALYSMFS